jgi:DNA (cytosine-5)-methyltransferase 1
LTPLECERLMGWPDHHTALGLYPGQDSPKAISDAQRYKMCGNGVVAPVAEWVGTRILNLTSTAPVVTGLQTPPPRSS